MLVVGGPTNQHVFLLSKYRESGHNITECLRSKRSMIVNG